jgi:hypothetical protein
VSALRSAVADLYDAATESVDSMSDSELVSFLYKWERKLFEAVLSDIRAGGSYEFKPREAEAPGA